MGIWDRHRETHLKALLLAILAVPVALFQFQVYVVNAFFQRRAGAPGLAVALLYTYVVVNLIEWLASQAFLGADRPPSWWLWVSILMAAIWIPYFKNSRRVKATFNVGGSVIGSAYSPLAKGTPDSSPSSVHTGPTPPEVNRAGVIPALGKENCPNTDDRVTSSVHLVSGAFGSGAEWHVIHAGKEIGPLSLAELVGKAALREIDPDDLVKTTCGLWTKAREMALLRQQFVFNPSREGAWQRLVNKLARLRRIYPSKNAPLTEKAAEEVERDWAEDQHCRANVPEAFDQKGRDKDASTECWSYKRQIMGIVIALECYVVLKLFAPPISAEAVGLRTVAIVATGVGSLRLSKLGTSARRYWTAETIWAVLFGLEGVMEIWLRTLAWR
jgi:hypothetical protein